MPINKIPDDLHDLLFIHFTLNEYDAKIDQVTRSARTAGHVAEREAILKFICEADPTTSLADLALRIGQGLHHVVK